MELVLPVVKETAVVSEFDEIINEYTTVDTMVREDIECMSQLSNKTITELIAFLIFIRLFLKWKAIFHSVAPYKSLFVTEQVQLFLSHTFGFVGALDA